MPSMKTAASCSALAVALVTATQARAQEQAAEAPTVAPTQDDQVGEIVVIAQKRRENMQNVPIAITAIDGSRLTNSSATISTTNLQQFVPGLVQGRSGTAGATFLRGVGTEAGTVGSEAPVPTYIDGIYLGINALGVFELNNVDQISVLKGPQGTLFGRNATGGAIQITTRSPSLDKASVSAEAGFGNYRTATARFYGSVPIAPTLAASVAFLYKNRAVGTVYNVATDNRSQDEKTFTGQAKVVWEPSSRTRVTLNGIFTDGRDLPGLAYSVTKGAVAQDGKTIYLGPHTVNLAADPYQRINAKIGALTISHDFGWAQLTNTVTRTVYENRAFNDQGMTPGLPNPGNVPASASNLNADVREFTEELQMQSPSASNFKWIVGLFYFHDRTDTSLRAFLFPSLTPTFGLNTRLGTDSYAAYAQATYEIVKNTNFTAGIRYTSDRKTFDGTNTRGGVPPATLDKDVTFPKLTWRFALDHKFGDNVLGYLSYNRGFRAGTYSPTSLTNPAARPETLDAFESGIKSDLLDRKLRLNLSGFYYRYSDLQLRQNLSVPGQAATNVLILNAAQARIYGIDVDFEARPTRHLSLTGGLELLSAKYRDFLNGPKNFPVGVPQLGMQPITAAPAGCFGTPRNGVGGHSNSVVCDLSGNDMINAPRFSATIAMEYTIPSNVGDFVLSIGDKYTGKSFATPDNVLVLNRYHYVTASIGWASPDEKFFGKIYVTNLNNSGRPAQMAAASNTYQFLPNDPRFYGFTVGFKY